jgi:hypothetical protein
LKFVILSFLLLATSCADPKWLEKSSLNDDDIDLANCSLESRSLDICLQLKWLEMPTEDDYGSFELKAFKGPDYTLEIPAPLEQLKVILWMPSMNHGSSPVTITNYSNAHFLIEDVFFIMPGDWDIEFHFQTSNGGKDEIIKQIHL